MAIALGLGTMIGWKRIVVTVGEKIGKDHLTYAQGASAELVAMGTICAADMYGLPVSTTHVLTSGVAGTMAANGSGLQWGTVQEPGAGLGADATGRDHAVRQPVRAVPLAVLVSSLDGSIVMKVDLELDQMQSAYTRAVEEWVAAIKHEEELASVNHSIAEIDQWEHAHFAEENARSKARQRKSNTKTRCAKKFYKF